MSEDQGYFITSQEAKSWAAEYFIYGFFIGALVGAGAVTFYLVLPIT